MRAVRFLFEFSPRSWRVSLFAWWSESFILDVGTGCRTFPLFHSELGCSVWGRW